MLVLRRLVTSSAVPVALAALAAVAACAGSTSGDDSNGGGGGTTVGTGTLCDAQTAWAKRCGTPTAPCDQDLITNCSALLPEMNPTVLDNARDCLESATSCDVTPSGCLKGASQNVAATSAQQLVATDYCTKCQPSDSDVCEQAFFSATGPAGKVSTQIVPYSDAIAAQIDACTSAASCASSFVGCAENVILNTLGSAVGSSTGDCVISSFQAKTGDDDDDDASVPPPYIADGDGSAGDGAAQGSSDAGSGEAGSGDGGSVTGGSCKDTYEPDDTSDTAAMLPELDDSAGTKTLMASISVAGQDDDWYFYVGNDALNFTTAADPYAMVQTLSPMEVCVWAKETGGYAIPVTDAPCKAGTLTPFPTAGLGYDIGCCSTSTTAQIYDYGRTGDDDTSDILMRVSQMASTLTCTDYSLTYAFKN